MVNESATVSSVIYQFKTALRSAIDARRRNELARAVVAECLPAQLLARNGSDDSAVGVVGTTIYRVVCEPSASDISTCKHDLATGMHPVLLVDRSTFEVSTELSAHISGGEQITIADIETMVVMHLTSSDAEERQSVSANISALSAANAQPSTINASHPILGGSDAKL